MRMRDLGEFIREQRRQAQLSLRKLSEQAGISNPYLSQIERGLRKPSADILQAIAKALRISAETLYMRAGILDEDSSGSDVVSAILKDKTITEGQKQTLIQIYHSFRIVTSRAPVKHFESEEGEVTTDGDAGGVSADEKQSEKRADVARSESGERQATDADSTEIGEQEVAV